MGSAEVTTVNNPKKNLIMKIKFLKILKKKRVKIMIMNGED